MKVSLINTDYVLSNSANKYISEIIQQRPVSVFCGIFFLCLKDVTFRFCAFANSFVLHLAMFLKDTLHTVSRCAKVTLLVQKHDFSLPEFVIFGFYHRFS